LIGVRFFVYEFPHYFIVIFVGNVIQIFHLSEYRYVVNFKIQYIFRIAAMIPPVKLSHVN